MGVNLRHLHEIVELAGEAETQWARKPRTSSLAFWLRQVIIPESWAASSGFRRPTALLPPTAGLERGRVSATISIEFEVGARVQIEGIPDPATLSNALVCLTAAERRR
jgi:hypothetical protein